jgi:hypothetical protein
LADVLMRHSLCILEISLALLEFERTYECENVAFEGGKSLDINNAVADEGVNGAKRI